MLQAVSMTVALAWCVSVSLVGGLVPVLRERLSVAFSRLYSSSVIDDLAGLLNPGAFDRAFSREIARADCREIALTVVLFDTDHFKQVNDPHGHAAGDEALRRFSRVDKTIASFPTISRAVLPVKRTGVTQRDELRPPVAASLRAGPL